MLSRGQWLLGGLLSGVAAVCHTLAAVLMRMAGRGASSLCNVAWKPPFWWSILLRAVGGALWWIASDCISDATVAHIFLIVSLITNTACAPSMLHEQYRTREVFVTIICMISAGGVVSAELEALPEVEWHGSSFPYPETSHRASPPMIFVTLWSVLTLAFVLLLAFTKTAKERGHAIKRRKRWSKPTHAVLIPVIAGIPAGISYSLGDFSDNQCFALNEWRPSNTTLYVVVLGSILALPSIVTAIVGAFHFDCRYFVPAYSTVMFCTAVFTRAIIADWWGHVQFGTLMTLFAANVALVVPPFSISSSPSEIQLPRMLRFKQVDEKPLAPSPYKDGTVDPLAFEATPFLEDKVGEQCDDGSRLDPEHAALMLHLSLPTGRIGSYLFGKWVKCLGAVPALGLSIVPVLMMLLHWRYMECPMCVLGSYTAFAVASTGLKILIYSGVGWWKVELCMQTNYADLLEKGQKRKQPNKLKGSYSGGGKLVVMKDPFDTDGSSSSEDDGVEWQSVCHFVLVEANWNGNCHTSLDDLRCLLASIASSPLAVRQIGVVFVTMPNDAHRAGFGALSGEFGKSFRWFMPVSVDESLSYDMMSRRTLQHLFTFLGEETQIHKHLALVTYTTADSVFHPAYFTALTFAFLASGNSRSRTIWQPPVLCIRDYAAQGFVVKRAALFLSQAQLASLTDPFAVPLPKSTFSIPLSLLRSVCSSWEFGFRMPLQTLQSLGMWTKCWLTTIGRSSVQPIFLPVMRCSIKDDSFTAFAQMQMYATGLLEVIYFVGAVPLALQGQGHFPSQCHRMLCLMLRSVPPLVGIMWTHVVMLTGIVAICLIVCMVGYGLLFWSDADVNSIGFLLGVTALLVALGFLPMSLAVDIRLMRLSQKLESLPGTLGRDSAIAVLLRRPTLHMLRLCLEGVIAGPTFLSAACAAECYVAMHVLLRGVAQYDSVVTDRGYSPPMRRRVRP